VVRYSNRQRLPFIKEKKRMFLPGEKKFSVKQGYESKTRENFSLYRSKEIFVRQRINFFPRRC